MDIFFGELDIISIQFSLKNSWQTNRAPPNPWQLSLSISDIRRHWLVQIEEICLPGWWEIWSSYEKYQPLAGIGPGAPTPEFWEDALRCEVRWKNWQLPCFLKQCKCKAIPTFYVIQKQAREWRRTIFGWWEGFLMLHFPTILNFSEKFWCWFCVCSMERWQVGYVFSDKTGGIHGFKTQDTAAAWFQLLMKEVIFLKMLGKFLNYHHLYCNPSKIVPLPQSLFFFKDVHRDTCAQSFDVNQKFRIQKLAHTLLSYFHDLHHLEAERWFSRTLSGVF